MTFYLLIVYFLLQDYVGGVHYQDLVSHIKNEKCKVYIVNGKRTISSTTVLGVLDKLDGDHTINFDIKVVFPSILQFKYEIVFVQQSDPGKMGKSFTVVGTKRGFHLNACSKSRDDDEKKCDGKIEKCEQLGSLFDSGDKLRVNINQFKDRFNYSRDAFVNDGLVKYTRNIEWTQAKKVQVVAIIPLGGKPIELENFYIGWCRLC